MYSPAVRVIRNQLAGLRFLRRWKDALGPTPREHTDIRYNGSVCRQHLLVLRELGSDAPLSQDIIEIGPGGNLGNALVMVALGARRVYCVDNYRHVEFQRGHVRFYQDLVSGILNRPAELLGEDFGTWGREQAKRALDDAVSFSRTSVHFNPERIRYLAPCDAANIPLEDSSADWIFSHAVLEHVKDPARVSREIARLTRPGGYTSHIIDLRDHFEPAGLQMLAYPEWLWRLMASNSHGFVNRCRAIHFEGYFRDAGFEVLKSAATETLGEADRIPGKLDRAFTSLTVEQLAVLGLFLVARK